MGQYFCAVQGNPGSNVPMAVLTQTRGGGSTAINELYGGPNQVKQPPPVASFASPYVPVMAGVGGGTRRYFFGALDNRIYYAHRVGDLPLSPSAFGFPPEGFYPLTVPLASNFYDIDALGSSLAVLLDNGDINYAIGNLPDDNYPNAPPPRPDLWTVVKIMNVPNALRLCAYFSLKTITAANGEVIVVGQGDGNVHIIVTTVSDVFEIFFNPDNPAGAGMDKLHSFLPPGRPGDRIFDVRGFASSDGFQHIVVAVSHQDDAGNEQNQLHEITFKPFGVQSPVARLIASLPFNIEAISCFEGPNNGGTVVALLGTGPADSQIYSGSYNANGPLTMQAWPSPQQIPFMPWPPGIP